ncbi:serine/threonine-protein kinase [Archangium lipolyticum]|uniref:serine/threonine-protein kinase n=1 Tax=Archangium lipolyticum TaxID=2970465 RepID=UPI00214A6DF8|nr:serine/threonine-protein kinase [Archangium lipolyticum]
MSSPDSQGDPIPENSPQIATPFGKYVLIKRLAMGGMAELFLAQAPPRSELVVIKRILPYLTEEPEFVQMFLDEARIAAQLHHPNIVQVFELGKIGDSIFIAMEYVEGADLRRILAEETKFTAAVPYAVASRICAQVAAGLDYAHNSKGVDGRPLGLIHRDVSPQNVMVAYDGSVKLVDFGIAKAEALAERSKPGVIKGKFLYLSPEAVMQERLDHRADIFALGTMLYEITTGRSPFSRPTTEAILYGIRFETPSPPHLIRDDYPQELSRIVMKCLAKDRAQRYQRASQVQADLEALLASGSMRGSDDVAAYIARLLGEEEERTVLHVPIAKNVPAAAPLAAGGGAGLTARPTRRSSAENLPSAGSAEVPEAPTEMARPRDMLAAGALGDDDDEEPTAIRTVPGRAQPSSVVTAAERPLPRAPTGESTLQDRPARASGSTPVRRSTPVRKPATSGPVSAVERRRPPPPVDDEISESVSVTPATTNGRQPGRAAPLFQDEDSGVEFTSEMSATADLVRPQRARKPDDEESGYGDTHTETKPASSRGARRPNLVLFAIMALLLVAAGVAAWLLLAPAPKPGLRKPPELMEGRAPTSPPSAPESGTGTAAAMGATKTDIQAGATTVATVQQAVGAPPEVEPPKAQALAAGDAAPEQEAKETPPPTPPAEVRVEFKVLARTLLKVDGQGVKPGVLNLAPGSHTVEYRCPGARTFKSRELEVPEQATRPVVFRVDKQDCRKARR